MIVNQFYPVLAVSSDAYDRTPELYSQFIEVEHQMVIHGMPYLVVVDASGNHTDIVRVRNDADRGLWGFRYNVNDIKEAKVEFEHLGATFTEDIIDTPKSYILIGKGTKNINIILFQHKD